MTREERVADALRPYFSAADKAYGEHHEAARAAVAAYESALREEGYVTIKASGPLTTAPNPVALTVAGRVVPLNEYEAIAAAVERCKTGEA